MLLALFVLAKPHPLSPPLHKCGEGETGGEVLVRLCICHVLGLAPQAGASVRQGPGHLTYEASHLFEYPSFNTFRTVSPICSQTTS